MMRNLSMVATSAKPIALTFPAWDSAKEEMIVGIVQPGGHLDYDVHFVVNITIGDVPIVGGQPALTVLKQLVGDRPARQNLPT